MSVRNAAAVIAILGLGAIAVFLALYVVDTQRPAASPSPTVALPSPSPTAAPSPTPTAQTAPPLTTTPAKPTAPASPQTGAITGRLQFPSEFIPPLTVYAIGTTDRNVWSTVDTPRYPLPTNTPPEPRYTITGVAPGTYYVVAYRNDGAPGPDPGLYSRYVIECRPGASSAACADHTLVPVTVRAGQTTTGIDVTDWYYTPQTRPSIPPRPTPR